MRRIIDDLISLLKEVLQLFKAENITKYLDDKEMELLIFVFESELRIPIEYIWLI